MIDAEKAKRALVTGGSGAIGAAICRVLAARGLQVIVHANNRLEAAEGLAAELRAGGAKAQAVAFDVTDRIDAARALGALVDESPIQVLVNNAGVHDDVPLAGMHGEQWDRVIGVSLTGFYNVTQPLLLPMIRTRWGRIVNISSVAGKEGNPNASSYSAAKAAVLGFTKSLGKELATKGVIVNAVTPATFESPILKGVPQAHIDYMRSRIPMDRLGTAAEIAAAVCWLASEECSFTTASTLDTSGGRTTY